MSGAARSGAPAGCAVAGLACLLVGAAALFWAWHGASGAGEIHWPGLAELVGSGYSRADGIVVRSGSFHMPASRGGVYPIVRFGVRGRSYEMKGAAEASEYLTPGTRVSVVYRTDDPTQAHIRGFRQMIPALMLAGAGVVLVAGGLLTGWYVLDSARKRPTDATG